MTYQNSNQHQEGNFTPLQFYRSYSFMKPKATYLTVYEPLVIVLQPVLVETSK